MLIRCLSCCFNAGPKLYVPTLQNAVVFVFFTFAFNFLMRYYFLPTVGRSFPLLPMFASLQRATGAGSLRRGPSSKEEPRTT